MSDHRYHHLHTETPLDPHSSYEGFYWSHLGWMLDSAPYKQRCGDQSNVADLHKQAWYRHSHHQYGTHLLAHFGLVYALGGVAGLCWRLFFLSLLYHVTWFVNSAAHLWGRQEYATGDQSRNNWWVGWLAFGEGWHNVCAPDTAPHPPFRSPLPPCHGASGRRSRRIFSRHHLPVVGARLRQNHHAFEYSARHGLRPRQFDITYAIIALFKRIGLVTQVKLPTEAALARLRLADA